MNFGTTSHGVVDGYWFPGVIVELERVSRSPDPAQELLRRGGGAGCTCDLSHVCVRAEVKNYPFP